MSLSQRRSNRLEPSRELAPLLAVATPRQLSARIQQAVSVLAGGLLQDEPHLAVEDFYHDLLLLSARLLFLQAGADQALLQADRRERRWLDRLQQAINSLRFLRARDGGIEPSRFSPTAVSEALTALQGESFTPYALGSAYESLLELHPVLNGGAVEWATAAGNARKTSGSYYTPDALIQCLLDTALEPVLAQCDDVLSLKVCDPSCGSGQFILAAAARMARRLAGRKGSEHEAQQAVALQCLYGVDLNPIAVELCRFHLWMASGRRMAPADVQQRVQWGDSLIGATPDCLSQRLPASAFAPLAGDDASTARAQFQAYQAAWRKPEPQGKRQADAWCATILWPRDHASPLPPIHTVAGDDAADSPATLAMLDRLAQQHRFLHWHLAFPHGGFDVVLGNPPWERIEVQDKEWFARREARIADAPNAAVRKRLVAELETTHPDLYRSFVHDRRHSQAELHFLRRSGRYPLTGRGGINRFGPFTETCRRLVRPNGRVGYVVPSGLVHDEMTRAFFQDLMATGSLLSLFHFDNRKKLFPAVGGMITFCLLTFQGSSEQAGTPASFVCFAQSPRDLQDPHRRFQLTADDLALMNPNTHTLPIFRSGADAELTRQVYRKVPVLIDTHGANPWAAQLCMHFQMSGDSKLFRTRPQEGHRPLYEAKLMHQYDHRWATYEGPRAVGVSNRNAGAEVVPRYWVPASEVERRLERRWSHDWLLVWRDVCRSTDERTVIAAIVPRVGVGHTCQLLLPGESTAALLLANLNSLVLDYVARQKIGGIHLTYNYLQQLPILPPTAYDPKLRDWIIERVVELTFTSHAVQAFAREHGVQGSPFPWNPERRAHLRAELDAAYFRLYGLSREQAEHVLSTFPILMRKEKAQFGEFRTRRLVLEALNKV